MDEDDDLDILNKLRTSERASMGVLLFLAAVLILGPLQLNYKRLVYVSGSNSASRKYDMTWP